MKNGPAAGFREEEIFSYVSLVCFARRVRDHVAEHFGHWIPRDEWDMLDDTVKQMAAEKVKEARMLPGVWREHSQTAETPVRWWSKVLPDGRMLGVSEHLSGKRCRACVLPAGFTDENATHIELGYKFLHPGDSHASS